MELLQCTGCKKITNDNSGACTRLEVLVAVQEAELVIYAGHCSVAEINV